MVSHTKHKERDRISSTSNRNRDLFRKQNKGTLPMPMFARRPSTMSSSIPVDIPQKPMFWTAKTAHIGAAIRQIPFLIFHRTLPSAAKYSRTDVFVEAAITN